MRISVVIWRAQEAPLKHAKKKKKKKDMMRSSTFKREKIALRLGGAVIKRMQYVQGRICGEHA